MSETPPDVSGNAGQMDPDLMDPDPKTSADSLNEALVRFTSCIGEAMSDICSYGLTIGETYVPFDPDPEDQCEEDEAICSQVWVRVDSAGVASTNDTWGGDCGGMFRLDIEVGVLRCLTIEEGGEAPKASEVMVAALQTMEDMRAIYCAAMSCEVWDSIMVGQWVPTGPSGGQYGGVWTFSVEVP